MRKLLCLLAVITSLMILISCSSTQNVGSPVSEPEQVSTETEQTVQESTETETTDTDVSSLPAEFVISDNYVSVGYSAVYEEDGISYYDVTITNKTDEEMTVCVSKDGNPPRNTVAAGETITVAMETMVDVTTSHSGTDTAVHFLINCRSNDADGKYHSDTDGWVYLADDGSYDTQSVKFGSSTTDDNSGEWTVEGQSSAADITAPTEVVNDGWIKATTANVDYAYQNSNSFRFEAELSVVNQSGRNLVIDGAGCDYADFADGTEMLLEAEITPETPMTKTFDFYVWDADSQEATGKEGDVIDYSYTVGRHYTVAVSCEGGNLSVSGTYDEIGE